MMHTAKSFTTQSKISGQPLTSFPRTWDAQKNLMLFLSLEDLGVRIGNSYDFLTAHNLCCATMKMKGRYVSANTINTAMYDLATDATSIQLLREFHDAGRIIVALCHGSAALVHVKLANGTPLVAGHQVTGFSNLEEEQATANEIVPPGMPFSLEDALNKASGDKYEKSGEAWSPHVIVDPSRKLLFGQNPASAHPLGEKLLEVLTQG